MSNANPWTGSEQGVSQRVCGECAWLPEEQIARLCDFHAAAPLLLAALEAFANRTRGSRPAELYTNARAALRAAQRSPA